METQERGVVDEFEPDSSSDEYQLLMAYCAQRRRGRSGLQVSAAPLEGGQYMLQMCSTSNDVDIPIEKKRKRTLVNQGGPMRKYRSATTGVVDRLAQIADSVQITSDNIETDIETDCMDDQEDVIQQLVELLKNSGDQLNEEIKRNKALQKHLQSSFSYALFERVTSTIQGRVAGAQSEEERLQKKQIALAFEVTSLLSAVDLLPMRRAMGYGERYVRLHHSSWVKQHGGWEKAFEYEDID